MNKTDNKICRWAKIKNKSVDWYFVHTRIINTSLEVVHHKIKVGSANRNSIQFSRLTLKRIYSRTHPYLTRQDSASK